MLPKSLSASALHVMQLCPSRYEAENINRSRDFGNSGAADLGTTLHSTFEDYINDCYIKKIREPTFSVLKEKYDMHFAMLWDIGDHGGEEYQDGLEIIKKWHSRQKLDSIEIVSCEVKESFPVKTSIGEIPFNFIWDRCDKLEDGVYRVVDYKSSRIPVQPDELKKKVQVRMYALAAQIKYPDAKQIWVQFDMLRYDTVGCVFSREENIAAWKWLRSIAEEILACTEPEEILNPECRFCIKKTSCSAVQKNADNGGILGIEDICVAVDTRARMQWQMDALAAAIASMDRLIMTHAEQNDVLKLTGTVADIEFKVSGRRTVQSERVEKIVGKDLFLKYGSIKMNLGDLQKLLKTEKLDPSQKKQLEDSITMGYGEPKVSIVSKNIFDE